MNVSSLTKQISAFRSITQKSSISPESLGTLLQGIVDRVGDAAENPDVEDVRDLKAAIDEIAKITDECAKHDAQFCYYGTVNASGKITTNAESELTDSAKKYTRTGLLPLFRDKDIITNVSGCWSEADDNAEALATDLWPVAFFDANQNFISGLHRPTTDQNDWTVSTKDFPQTAKFFILSNYATRQPSPCYFHATQENLADKLSETIYNLSQTSSSATNANQKAEAASSAVVAAATTAISADSTANSALNQAKANSAIIETLQNRVYELGHFDTWKEMNNATIGNGLCARSDISIFHATWTDGSGTSDMLLLQTVNAYDQAMQIEIVADAIYYRFIKNASSTSPSVSAWVNFRQYLLNFSDSGVLTLKDGAGNQISSVSGIATANDVTSAKETLENSISDVQNSIDEAAVICEFDGIVDDIDSRAVYSSGGLDIDSGMGGVYFVKSKSTFAGLTDDYWSEYWVTAQTLKGCSRIMNNTKKKLFFCDSKLYRISDDGPVAVNEDTINELKNYIISHEERLAKLESS